MSNNTFNNEGQSKMSVQKDELNRFLESSGVEELDDVVCVAVNGGNLIGNQLGVIDIASQNTSVNNGNTGVSISLTENTQNTAQQVVTDAQSVDVIKNFDIAKHPLVLV